MQQQALHQMHQQQQQQKQSMAYQKQRALSDEAGKTAGAALTQQQINKMYQKQGVRYQYAGQEPEQNHAGEQQTAAPAQQSHYLVKHEEKKTHRRSKTDGNLGPQQLPAALLQQHSSSLSQFKLHQGQSPHDAKDLRQNNKLGANLITNLNQLAAAQVQQQMQNQGMIMSRQAAVNSRIPGQPGFGMIAQASGHSAQSAGAHLQMKLAQGQSRQVVNIDSKSKSGGTGGASLHQQNSQQRQQSVEQAAKRFRLKCAGDDPNQASTRNSNLMSQPKKDKLQQVMFGGDQQQVASAASHNSQSPHVKMVETSARIAHQMRPFEADVAPAFNQSRHQNSNLMQAQKVKRDPPATVPRPQVQLPDSIQPSSTGSLSKGSSAASSQLNLNLEQYKLKLKQLMKNPQIAQFLKEQLELQDMQQAQQQKQQQQSQQVQAPPQPALVCSESNMNSDTSQEILRYQKEWARQFHEHVNNNSAPGANQIENKDDYQQQSVQTQQTAGDARMEKSREQIVLPDSLNARNMQNLNKGNVGMAIDFYQRPETDPDAESDCNVTSSVKKPRDFNYNPTAENQIMFEQHRRADDEDDVQQEAGEGFIPTEQTDSQIHATTQAEPTKSRNIMNGGKQLSFMTVCSDVMDHSAELNLENLHEDSNASFKDEEEEYLTFQLCDGEEMNNEMANFIGIHMLNDGCLESGDTGANAEGDNDGNGGLTYQCPVTGSHFEHNDIVGRITLLGEKRRVLDEAIRQEDERQKVLKKQKKWESDSQVHEQNRQRQKQLEKQRRQKTQVQNILKQAANNPPEDISGDEYMLHVDDMDDGAEGVVEDDQQDHMIGGEEVCGPGSDEGKLSSIQHGMIRSSGMPADDEELLMMAEDEQHLQRHHITTNARQTQQPHNRIPPMALSKMRGPPLILDTHTNDQAQQWHGINIPVSSAKKGATKIYNTHDGRQQKHAIVDDVSSPEVLQIVRGEGDAEMQQNVAPGHQWVRPQEIDKRAIVHGAQLGVSRPKQKKSTQQTTDNQTGKPTGKSTGLSSYVPQQPMSNLKAGSINKQKQMSNTFHHHAVSQVTTTAQNVSQMHQAGSLASDHASKISQISIGSGGRTGPHSNQPIEAHVQLHRGVEFNSQGAPKSKQIVSNIQSSSNERQQYRKTGPAAGMSNTANSNQLHSSTMAQKKHINQHVSSLNRPQMPTQQVTQKLKKPFSGNPTGVLKLQQHQQEFSGFTSAAPTSGQPNRALSGGQAGYVSNTSGGGPAQHMRQQAPPDHMIQFNTGNLKKGTYQTFFQTGTHAINSNHMSTMKGTNNMNSNQLTALPSHRGEPELSGIAPSSQQQVHFQQSTMNSKQGAAASGQRILVHGSKIKKHAPTSSMDSNVNGQLISGGQTFEHRPSKPSLMNPQAPTKKSQQSNSQQPVGNDASRMPSDAQSLRQTAQFGPQMNLIKSQLQTHGGNVNTQASRLSKAQGTSTHHHQQHVWNSNQQPAHSKLTGQSMQTTKPLRGTQQQNKKNNAVMMTKAVGKSADQRQAVKTAGNASHVVQQSYIVEEPGIIQGEGFHHEEQDLQQKRDSLVSYEPGASSATTEELFTMAGGLPKRGMKPEHHMQAGKMRAKQMDQQIDLKNQMSYGGPQVPQTVQPTAAKKYAINVPQQAQTSSTMKQRNMKAVGHTQSYSFDFREGQGNKPQQPYVVGQGSSSHLQGQSTTVEHDGRNERNSSALQHSSAYHQVSQQRQRQAEQAYLHGSSTHQQQMKIKSSSLSQRKEARPTQLQESIGDYEQVITQTTQPHQAETEKTPKGQMLLHGNNFSQQNQQVITTPNNGATVKSKRLTAATRGINNGTNARVNTFDNRAGGPAQTQARAAGAPQQHQMNSHMGKTAGLSGNQLLQQKRMQASKYIRKSHQNQIQHHYNQLSDQEQFTQHDEAQQDMDFLMVADVDFKEGGASRANYTDRVQQQEGAGGETIKYQQQQKAQVHQQMHSGSMVGRQSATGVHHTHSISSAAQNSIVHQKSSKSPKKNIYLLNFQGNVSIV